MTIRQGRAVARMLYVAGSSLSRDDDPEKAAPWARGCLTLLDPAFAGMTIRQSRAMGAGRIVT
jgi:hypothetical protein